MSYCDGQIQKDIVMDCKNIVVRGVEQEGVVINRSDIDFDKIVYDAANSSIIKQLPLKAGKRGYKVVIPTARPFSGTTTTLAEGEGRRSFTNTVGMAILANDPDVSENVIDSLANGSFVVIMENKNKNLNRTEATEKGFSTFQVYGLMQGLTATTLEEDKYSEITDSGWNVLLTETGVPKSGLFMFNTDASVTRQQFESLTEPTA